MPIAGHAERPFVDGGEPPYAEAGLAALVVFGLYALTLAPTTAFWDASEYIATAHILGIPHPPGNPLFVVLARVWELLLAPTGLSVAVRINLFAAGTSAAAAGFWYLVAHRLAYRALEGRWAVRTAAGAATLISATAFTVWNQSNVNEKVYTVSVLIIAAVSWLAVRWYDRRDDPGSVRLLLLAGYLMVLGTTNHLMSALPIPALGLLVLMARPSVFARRDVLARAVPLILVGLSFNFFLPIRSAQDPVINEGQPTCESVLGAVVSVYTNGNRGCQALSDNLQRVQYAKPDVSERMAPLSSQLLNYFQYFDWQWARGLDPSEQPVGGRLLVTLIFMGLGIMGLTASLRADRALFMYMAVLVGTVTVGLVFYLNFKYGYSLAPEITDARLHEVRERDYFFIASFSLWGVLAGLGLTRLWSWLARQFTGDRRFLLASPVMVVALIPLAFNWSWASRAGDYAARDWAHDLLASVAPYSVLFTNGDNDTFPLWYAQEVEEFRRDVTVVVVQYLSTDWYPKQLQRLTSPGRQRLYDPEHTAGVYPAPTAPPSSPILSLTPQEMDQVRAGRISQDLTVAVGPVGLTFPAGSVLDRGQLLTLAIVRDAMAERPIFFASTAGAMAAVGLDRWATRRGLGVEFQPDTLGQALPDGVVQLPPEYGAARIDVPTSRALSEQVFQERSLGGREIWSDRATLNIPLQYYIMYLQLAEGMAQSGASSEVAQGMREKAETFLDTYETGRP